MTENEALFLKSASEYNGNSAEIISDYSGRGMMGKTTVAVSVPSVALLLVDVVTYIKEMGLDNMEFISELPDFAQLHTDNLGRDTVLY